MDSFNYIVNIFLSGQYKLDSLKGNDSFILDYNKSISYLNDNNINRLDYETIIEKINNSELVNIFKDVLKEYKSDLMFKSDIHGISHIIRTSIFLLVLSVFENINQQDFILSLESILYHDVGRVNDIDDDMHGYNATKKIDFLKDKYNDNEYNYIRAAITAHSLDDDKYKYVANHFNITDVEKYYQILSLVKDADALDRVREYPYIDTKYLRTTTAKKLVCFAYEFYYNFSNNLQKKEA